MSLRAEELLGIFIKEKGKRGQYTYEKLPQANKDPAKESKNNANLFFKQIGAILSY